MNAHLRIVGNLAPAAQLVALRAVARVRGFDAEELAIGIHRKDLGSLTVVECEEIASTLIATVLPTERPTRARAREAVAAWRADHG